ncbi:insulin-like growth factor-binding protein 1 [Lycaon pictus]
MPVAPAARAWPPLLLLAVQLGATAGTPQPWHCAPCTPEKLALCPPVPASCAETTLPAGCGCCPMCALPQDAPCGVATARCATGLSCRAAPGEERPLHALIRGRGVCVPTDPAADAKESSESSEITQEQLLENFHLMVPSEEDTPILWNAVRNYKTVRSDDSDKLKEPCRRELHEVLARLAEEQASRQLYSFYLPNCNKNGFYHSRQCKTAMDGQRGLCWCVYPWNGERIPGSVEVRGDPNCGQYFTGHS